MPNKSFSIYSLEVEEGDQLVIEIAKSHLACLISTGNKRAVSAYELFRFNEDEGANFPTLFSNIFSDSKILHQKVASSSIYLNNEFCLPVPVFKFNKEIAADYLKLVFGEDHFSTIQFEHLPIEPDIMNVFRVNSGCFNWLSQNLSNINYHHTYSNIIRRVTDEGLVHPPECISVQFYNAFGIVIVLKDSKFQLIQSFTYETPDDVLYYLFNIAQQLGLFSKNLLLQLSGMIELDSPLYRELVKQFKDVRVQNIKTSNLLLNVAEHPLHYFTPFFNLAL